MPLLARIVLNAVAIGVAAWFVPGLSLAGPFPAIIAGAIFGVVNALVKPVLILFTLPLTMLTLGLFLFVVNGLCLGLTAALVPGFDIRDLWSAVLGAVVVSLVSWILNGLLLPSEKKGGVRS